jgi:hypothetical protein
VPGCPCCEKDVPKNGPRQCPYCRKVFKGYKGYTRLITRVERRLRTVEPSDAAA